VGRYLNLSATTLVRQAAGLRKETQVFYFAFKHPRVPWYAKLVAAGTAAYLLSPVQLIPSFIPVIGFLDDLLVVLLGVKLLRKIIPADVFVECRRLAEAAEAKRARMRAARQQSAQPFDGVVRVREGNSLGLGREKTRSSLAVVGLCAIATVWLFAAITAGALIAAYIHR
jgi:uncharacterized membrane protein YkvA (DUF1232 family)